MISRKQNNGRAYETKVGDKEHQFDYCFEFEPIQNPDLSEYLLIIYPNLIDFRLFILQYTKKKPIKTYILVISFSLEIAQIEKILIEISKFENLI